MLLDRLDSCLNVTERLLLWGCRKRLIRTRLRKFLGFLTFPDPSFTVRTVLSAWLGFTVGRLQEQEPFLIHFTQILILLGTRQWEFPPIYFIFLVSFSLHVFPLKGPNVFKASVIDSALNYLLFTVHLWPSIQCSWSDKHKWGCQKLSWLEFPYSF